MRWIVYHVIFTDRGHNGLTLHSVAHMRCSYHTPRTLGSRKSVSFHNSRFSHGIVALVILPTSVGSRQVLIQAEHLRKDESGEGSEWALYVDERLHDTHDDS
jgi:hypothetical protein